MLEIRPIVDPAALEELVNRQPLQPFLQAWSWGEFQHSLGRRIWRIGAYDGEQLVGAALIIRHELVFGRSYLYCPRGPIADHATALRMIVEAMYQLGQQQGVMYVKIDPGDYTFRPDWNFDDFIVRPGTTLQPQQTLILDVSQPLEQLLASLHQKTRYNIRLAEKRGVTVRWSTKQEDIAPFLRLLQATAARQDIRLHADGYYQKLFAHLGQHEQAELAIAELHGRPLAANLVLWRPEVATYLHGGSSDADKEHMAPHALQWSTICRAHERGIRDYDLWGVAPEGEPDHRWAGVTRFKRGFGGRYHAFPMAANIILQPQWHQLYRLAKRLRGGVDE